MAPWDVCFGQSGPEAPNLTEPRKERSLLLLTSSTHVWEPPCWVPWVCRLSPPDKEGLAFCHPPCGAAVGRMRSPTESLRIPGCKSSAPLTSQALVKRVFSVRAQGTSRYVLPAVSKWLKTCFLPLLRGGQRSCYKLLCDDRMC